MKGSIGPLVMGIDGVSLGAEEKELLRHPLLGGVILFQRNFESRRQLTALCAQIHALRSPRLLLMADQEGGRVQRFTTDFTPLPCARSLGRAYDREARSALELTQDLAWLLAAELGTAGLDFSLAPVLDLDWGRSAVIGDRALHADAEVVGRLGAAWVRGVRRAGMAAVGKHFPGHGWTRSDSHAESCTDEREYWRLRQFDLVPFERAIQAGLDAVMLSHVNYPDVAAQPAVYSPVWIKRILRAELGFQGLVLSDDICMRAAAQVAAPADRAVACLQAGCDLVLVCSERGPLLQILQHLPAAAGRQMPEERLRRVRFHGSVPDAVMVQAQQSIRARLAELE